MDFTCFTQQLHCTAFLLLLFSCLFSLDYNLKIQWLIFFGLNAVHVMRASSISACLSPRFTCRRSCVSLQLIWSSREISLFFSFSGMNNIPRAGERAYQEANRRGEREIEACVTDKIVAQLVFLTAPWAGEREEQVHQSVRQGFCLHT